MNFFKESKMPTYQKMWEFMSGPMKEEVMVSGNGEGIEKVVNDDGGYAFMMESSSIQVHILHTPHKPECKKTVRGVWRPVIIGSPHKYQSNAVYPTCFITRGTPNTNSKEHCMCVKEKQNISSQSFSRNLSHF